MKYKATFLFLLLSVALRLYGQGQQQREPITLSELFLNADSIEILSHQDLRLSATMEEVKQGLNGYWRTIIDEYHQLNECIVMERSMLNKDAITELRDIWIVKRDAEIPVDKASCFNPHETILFYRNGLICAWVDVCFGCRRYAASPAIAAGEELLLTESAWQHLKIFFNRHGIRYESL